MTKVTTAQIGLGVILDINVIEPWELGDRVFSGRILKLFREPDDSLRIGAVQLLDPLVFRGQNYEYFAMVPRRASASLDELATAPVDCNLTSIAGGEAMSNHLDVSTWRSGVGMIATVQARR